MRTQSNACQNADQHPDDLELVNYGAGYAWFRRELDAAIADADQVERLMARLLERRDRRSAERRYVLTDAGRRALDEARRARAMQALFGPWPTVAEVCRLNAVA